MSNTKLSSVFGLKCHHLYWTPEILTWFKFTFPLRFLRLQFFFVSLRQPIHHPSSLTLFPFPQFQQNKFFAFSDQYLTGTKITALTIGLYTDNMAWTCPACHSPSPSPFLAPPPPLILQTCSISSLRLQTQRLLKSNPSGFFPFGSHRDFRLPKPPPCLRVSCLGDSKGKNFELFF